MVNWKLFDGDGAAWDEALKSLAEPAIFQGSRWAAHKQNSGWSAVRLIADSAAVQFLIKRAAPGTAIAWARGGPAGKPADWNKGMVDALRGEVDAPLLYARLCSYRSSIDSAEDSLHASGWNRCSLPLNKDTTMILDLTPEPEAIENNFSSNWRHNLKRGRKRCAAVRVWENPDPAEMTSVYRDMESYKGLKPEYDEEALRSLLKHLGNTLVVFRADDETGSPIALRAAAIEHGRAWDLLAATSQTGRKSYAAFALMWESLLECRRRGADSIDLGGVDPDGAKGVFDFKKGTGASLRKFLGEWDWASPAPLRSIAAAAIKFRGVSG